MIRKAQIEDLSEILAIIKLVKKKMVEEGNPQWDSDYPGETEYKGDIEKGELFLSGENRIILGFMTINDSFPKEYGELPWTTSLPAFTIHRLAVNPTCTNRGVAKEMFKFAETYALEKGKKSIRLDTFSKNIKAQELFKRNNYCFVGEIFMKGKPIPYYCFEKNLL